MGKTVRTCVRGGPVQALRQTKSVWHCACVGRLIFYYGAKKPQVPLGGFLAPLKGGRREEVGGGGVYLKPQFHSYAAPRASCQEKHDRSRTCCLGLPGCTCGLPRLEPLIRWGRP